MNGSDPDSNPEIDIETMKKIFSHCLLILGFLIPVITVSQITNDQLKQIRSEVRQKIDGKEYYIHIVKKGQTLYMISKAYGVDVNEVIKENPEVKQGIKADLKLRIPVPGQKSSEPAQNLQLSKVQDPSLPLPDSRMVREDTLPQKPADTSTGIPCSTGKEKKDRVYKVALMLPLVLSEVNRIDPQEPDIAETLNSLKFIEFYEGFRMALDSLEKSGLKLKLFVYDIGKDTARARQVLKKPEMKKMDLIIGLIYHMNFQMVAEFAKKNKIPIVNPISERSDLIKGNPWVFKVCPSRKAQLTNLSPVLEQNFSRSQILIVRNNQYKDRDAPDQLKKECAKLTLSTQVVDGTDNAISRLSKSKENVLVFFAENNNYILDLSRKLSERRNDYTISIVGLPAWDKIEELETDYMVNLNAHLIAPYFIDYNNASVKKFTCKFQETIKTDPGHLAFLGYDIGYYFLSALMKYGGDFMNCIGDYTMKGLQSTFEFRQEKGSGFENQHWEIYKFDNYKLVKIN